MDIPAYGLIKRRRLDNLRAYRIFISHTRKREGYADRWPSGLRRTLGKRVRGQTLRGFESRSVRHFYMHLLIRA